MATTKETLTDLPVFDTRKYVRTLTREGSFNEKQANANADGLQEAMRGVATKAETQAVKIDLKADIREVRAEIKEVKADIREVKAEIRRLEEKMDVQFQALRTEMKASNQAMQEQMQGMRQLMVVGFSVIAIVVGAATLFG